MKITLYQPDYPGDYKETLRVMESMIEAVGNCPRDVDLLVLPEYSNCPGMKDMGKMATHCRKYNDVFLSSLTKAAAAKNTAVCVNMLFEKDNKFTNSTFLINKDGGILTKYDKTHLAYTEIDPMGLTAGSDIAFVEFMGVRISFAVCFELYFPEFFESVAAGRPDIILSPSYQRSESSEILLKQAMGRALDSESFIIRSSYSMGSASKTGGTSYVVNPSGEVLLNAGQETGLFSVEISPLEKRLRPLAHGLDKLPSRQIVEKFRRPAVYRINSLVRRPLSDFSYPRVCAHRGLSGLVPENTLPSFAAAVAVGADEIEFDIRITKDNKMIVCHDSTVDRVSDGSGNVSDFTFSEIRKLNAGEYMGWNSILFPEPEEIFRLFGGQIIMNIHVYETGIDGFVIKELKRLIHNYDLPGYVYFAAQEKEMELCLSIAPEIDRCMLECFDDSRDIVDIAKLYDCCRVQHFYTVYSADTVKKANSAGLVSNLFFEDDPGAAVVKIGDGIDTVLSNYPDRIIPVIKIK